MVTSVPRNVGESDERPIGRPRRHPAEAVRPNPFPPPVLRPASMRDHEIDHFVVVQGAAPNEDDAISEPVSHGLRG